MNNQDREATTYEIKLDENMNKILQAIGGMRQELTDRFDKIEREQAESKQEFAEFKTYVEAQFEAVRQGIVQNHTQYNQIISEVSQNRSAIFSTKSTVCELQEQMYQLTKNISQPI